VRSPALPPGQRAGDAKGELGIRHEDTKVTRVNATAGSSGVPDHLGARFVMQIDSCHHLHQEVDVRTTLNIDDAALAGAMKSARGKTKTAVINEALLEYARRRRVRRLLEFRGRVRWEGNLDDLRGRERTAR